MSAENTETPPGTFKPSFRMSMRDLINIGIFLVLYFITMAVNATAAAGPVWIYLALVISAPLGGIVFELFLTRVQHAGMILIFGIIFGAGISTIHGWQTMITVLFFSLLSETIVYLGRYRSKLANLWAYPAFQLWCMGPIIPILFTAQAYRDMLINQRGKSVEYADGVIAWSHNPLFITAIVAGIVLLSIVGAWVGQKLLRKHFEKAGIA